MSKHCYMWFYLDSMTRKSIKMSHHGCSRIILTSVLTNHDGSALSRFGI